ncbi:MAG: hypothetical protein U0930_12490 [Pirellulales bacterium]
MQTFFTAYIFVPDLHTANFQTGLAASWSLTSKYRRSIEAADGVTATIAAYDEARSFDSWWSWPRATFRCEWPNRDYNLCSEIEIQQKTLKLAEDKLAAGVGTGLDTAQAKNKCWKHFCCIARVRDSSAAGKLSHFALCWDALPVDLA